MRVKLIFLLFILTTNYCGNAQTSIGVYSGINSGAWRKSLNRISPHLGIDVKHRNYSNFRPGLCLFLSPVPLGKTFPIQNQQADIAIQFESVIANLYCDLLLTNNEKINYGTSLGIGLVWLGNNEVSLVNGDGSIYFTSSNTYKSNLKWSTLISGSVFIDYTITPKWWIHLKLGVQQFITPNKLNGTLSYNSGSGQRTVELNESLNPLRVFVQIGIMYHLNRAE